MRVPAPSRSSSERFGRGRRLVLFLAPGAAWAAFVFGVVGFRVPPGPETPTQWAILAATCVCLAAVHAGFAELVAASLAGRRRFGLAAGAAAIALGVGYAVLALSLLKFVAVRAHLRLSDLRFVAGSLRQLAGESTPRERDLLLLGAVLPTALAVAWFVWLRSTRSPARALARRWGSRVLVAGLASATLLAALRPEARWLLRTLVPETALAARWFDESRFAAARVNPDPARQARIAPYRVSEPPAQWDVVVVMLESVPWKRVFGAEARPGTTPRLAELAQESSRFERAYASSVHSDYAQTSILASLFPQKFPHHDFFVDLAYPRLLPWDLLAPLGWRSAIFSTQNERWGNMRAFLETPALDTFRHAPDFPAARRRGRGVETKIFEEETVPAFLEWVASEPARPFVAYLNFQATHFPYIVPPEAEGAGARELPPGVSFLHYPPELAPLLLERFHAALAYQDFWLGRLIDGLRAQGRWERTALLVVADHGEAFHEHGQVTHGTSLYEEQIRVPMLLRIPDRAPRTVAEPVSTLDALPTLYRAMGLPRHGALQGRDDLLEAPASARFVPFCVQGMTSARGLVSERWKWFYDADRAVGALFDLVADPRERRNLASRQPAQAPALAADLDRFFEAQLGFYRVRMWRDGWYAPRLP